MAQSFSAAEWDTVHRFVEEQGEELGLPARRDGSIVIGSFNVRKLGARDHKSDGSWSLIAKIIDRFDLIAIQEVQDDLGGVRFLKESLLERRYGIVASDITGSYPGQRPSPERLAFFYRGEVVERTEITSDITYDRGKVLDTLYTSRLDFWKSFDRYTEKLSAWKIETELRRAQGKDPKTKPVIKVPEFLTFIRQPLCCSFRLPKTAQNPYEFLAVNAHLLYGRYKAERRMEFQALIAWMVDRARQVERIYYPNMVLLGDLNLDYENVEKRREEIDTFLKGLNKDHLDDVNAELNFPFLDVHPGREDVFRTNARQSQTFDQVGLVCHDRRLPTSEANDTVAGQQGPDAYDYGVFHFVELFSQALHGKSSEELTEDEKDEMFKKFEHDFSDHMPIWIRLPKPE